MLVYFMVIFGLFTAIWYILWPSAIFYGHSVYFSPVSVCCTNTNLATLNWGRCYDHNVLRFSPIFGEKIGVFLQNQFYDQLFSKFSFVLSQKRQFFGENILKIITSVPDSSNRPLQRAGATLKNETNRRTIFPILRHLQLIREIRGPGSIVRFAVV
jgi:hypothetical protein